jgi:hypothetical protein
MYNRAIKNKVKKLHPFIPPHAERCVGMTDAARYRIARPNNALEQRRCFNGKDHIHCLQNQVTIGPDGMAMDVYGPVPGARHDAYTNRESRFNDRMQTAQVQHVFVNNVIYIIYIF